MKLAFKTSGQNRTDAGRDFLHKCKVKQHRRCTCGWQNLGSTLWKKNVQRCEQLYNVRLHMQYRPQARRVGRPALSIIHSPSHSSGSSINPPQWISHSASATQDNSVFKSNSQLEMCLDSRPFFHKQGWIDFNTRHSSIYKEGFPDPLPREGLMLMIECPYSTKTRDFLLSSSGMDFQYFPFRIV